MTFTNMSYTEMYEQVYRPKSREDAPVFFTEDCAAAWRLIYGLNERAGFDHWWGRLLDEIRDEIFEEIKFIIREVKDDLQSNAQEIS